MGRIGFYLNTISVVGIGTCLFYIIYNHLFEYHYAWAHSSRTFAGILYYFQLLGRAGRQLLALGLLAGGIR
jgi:hypothetical protein